MNLLTELKQAGRVFLIVLVYFALTRAAQAANPPTTTVYPTGSFPLDVQNVQAAINSGGTVLLKATNAADQPTAFNFGATGVDLTTDVIILGETVGQNETTIQGGFAPIRGLVPVQSTIQSIDFEGPLDSPIILLASTGADIIGNRIRGCIPTPICLPPCEITEVEGMLVSPLNPQDITGRIRVANNDIELSAGDFANGMQFDEVSADIEVSGNTVHFVQSNGVIQTFGILVFRSHGNVRVVNNSVTMGPGDPNAFPAGIFIGGHSDANYMISGNTVITNHLNSDGIDIVGLSISGSTEHAIVEGNHISIHSLISTAGGISLDGAVNNSVVSANQIEGTSGNALQIFGLGNTLIADSNQAVGNDISQLSALNGDVFFGLFSTNNLVAGHCATYIDLGVGNRITCGRPIESPVAAKRTAIGPSRGFDVLGVDDIKRARLEIMVDGLTNKKGKLAYEDNKILSK